MEEIIIRIPVFKTQTEQEEVELFNANIEGMVDSACTKINVSIR